MARANSIFAHSAWDIVPVLMGIGHFAYVIGLFFAFEHLPFWAFALLAFVYSVSISWDINSVSHNQIHNPFFRSDLANRLFNVLLSVTMAFSQTMYHYVHMRHHSGNMDRPGPDGTTVDLISIYRHGKDGKAENVWAYTFLSYFRDDPVAIYKAIKARRPKEAFWSLVELACVAVFWIGLLVLDWRFILALLPFYYVGHSFSSLNGFFEHFGGNPDRPIAWGVSTYNRIYNWTWLYNGYHAEHHYRPKVHWTKMRDLHGQIAEQQKEANVRVIGWSHMLGFLDRRLRKDWRDGRIA